ncbi:MAG: hypothetical protein A3H35_16005 [Betaproteobacteria bacterium RIFCSPLOWO2_02_FULL_62_17]|nr:MAG: hypothetical protein A3H35_16005 [Betaproteobacteria bacterium RIFCSPLOWO2_02_FULL_62_17]
MSVARNHQAVARFLKPRSIAIIGMSARPGSAGQTILQCLKINQFEGAIHLVGRNAESIDGRPVLTTMASLPEGVDLAVLTLPAVGVRDAIAACVERRVGSALVFAAGFAEVGERAVQEDIAAIAREGKLAIVGPNCLGYTNNVDGLLLHMLTVRAARRDGAGAKPGIAIIGQSGGMLAHLQWAIEARGVTMSYLVTTGNEAGLDSTDFLDYLIDDAATRVAMLYAEQVRRPQAFLAACRRARAAGKPIVMLHPGQGTRAREAVQSHTGALVGDYGAMRTSVERAGVLLVESLDELIDVCELLARYPNPLPLGPAIFTASGAFVAIANDFCDKLDMQLPPLLPDTEATLKKLLPAFGNAGNPLDSTAGASAAVVTGATRLLLEDANIGSVFVSFPLTGINGAQRLGYIAAGTEGATKPVVVAALGDYRAHAPEILAVAKEGNFIFSRSPDRSLRALALYTGYGRSLARAREAVIAQPVKGLPDLGKGSQPEWLGKKVLAAAGIPVPEGGLARNIDEALGVAARVGYPLALKAQAAALAHKTEAGGVILNISGAEDLRRAWGALHENVLRAAPGVVLEGALVERMAPRGLELMVGAKRDPAWGPVLLVGLGGIWVEALGDVRLLPPDASHDAIVDELMRLRSAKLFSGFRESPPVDIDAVADAVAAIGGLMETLPEINEIDVNPLIAHARGQGAMAVDALIVTRQES